MPAPPSEASYRLRLADGFLEEASQDRTLSRWRSCVDNCQLATENAAKAALALLGPVGRTHDPAGLLRRALAGGEFSTGASKKVTRLATCAQTLGQSVHVQSDYGDEVSGKTPWEIFGEQAATQAHAIAEEAEALAHELASA